VHVGSVLASVLALVTPASIDVVAVELIEALVLLVLFF